MNYKHFMRMFLAAIIFAMVCSIKVGAQTTGPEKGALVVVGGGIIGPEIWKEFVSLAGGPNADVVFIPTAEEDRQIADDPIPATLKSYGVESVTVLNTRDPKEADTEKFVAPLKKATAVWFGGGRQWHLADSYLGTRTVTELNALLDRGGVIGGWSAGASIQASFLVRGDTSSSNVVIGDHQVGFGFLKNAAIDQHILVRNRQFDLAQVVQAHPELLGIGIDESTAIVVQKQQFQVIGSSYVAITDASKWASGSGSPNNAGFKGKCYFLASGQKFDLATRSIVPQPRGSQGTYVGDSVNATALPPITAKSNPESEKQ